MGEPLSESFAAKWIGREAFHIGPVGLLGIELEWIVRDRINPQCRPTWARLCEAVSDLPVTLPAGGVVSFEPGGQIELSTMPCNGVGECLTRAELDMRVIREALGTAGMEIADRALDERDPERVVPRDRYAALEAHYAMFGPAGRWMINNTAAIQVSVQAGTEAGWAELARRWWLAYRLGPVLVAVFANSPARLPVPCRSGRQWLRFHTDPSRTDPPAIDGDPRAAWSRYALDAYAVRGVVDPGTGPDRLSMRDWISDSDRSGPDLDELRAHLSTVIPPVRPRGHLEIRMIDAQEYRYWAVPVIVIAALLDDRTCAERAARIAAGLADPAHRGTWLTAARWGLAGTEIAAAARDCFEAIGQALPRLEIPAWAAEAFTDFADRYVSRGRCPANDRTWLAGPAPSGRTPVRGRAS
jgi:glutamate--cysteine ligase